MAKIDSLFATLIKLHGSDLHLEQGQAPKVRIHGKLTELAGSPPLSQEQMIGLLKEIASDEDWRKFEYNGDLDFAYALGTEARFRANYFRHFHGVGAVFRLIPSKIRPLRELDLPKSLEDFADLRAGLVLVTGPTGSGKSTTLASIIDHINEFKHKKIITIEEPVEFIHPNKNSILVHREVGLDTASFASGLRSALKSDIDIILVGEMRDRETIELALLAAERGILVFGTLHTNSAVKTIDRIIDVFPSNKKSQIRTVLANCLKGVVAQQLVPSSDGQRRHIAYEILLSMPSLGPMIIARQTHKLTSEIQTNRKRGMILIDDCLLQLVVSGKVKKEDAYVKALDKSKFQ